MKSKPTETIGVRQLTDLEREAVSRLLFNAWLPLEFRYDRLTERDRKVIDPETFRTLAIFARDPRCHELPPPPGSYLHTKA